MNPVRLLFIVLGLLVLAAGVYVYVNLASPAPLPETAGVSSAFSGTSALDPAEVERTMDDVYATLTDINDRATQQRQIADYLLIAVIVLGGLTTLLGALQDVVAKGPALAVVVGIIGALSGGMTAGATHLDEAGESRRQCIDETQALVGQLLTAAQNEPNEAAARQYLEQIKLRASRCEA